MPSPAAPHHPDRRALGEAEAGVEVDLDDLVPLGVGCLARGLGVAVAGVVDQDVEAAELGLDAIDRRVGGGDVGGVEGERRRPAAGRHDRGARRRDAGFVAAVDHDMSAAAGERQRHGAPQAA
jgi:hypothetical protein